MINDPRFIGDKVYLRGLEHGDLFLRPKWLNSPEIYSTLLIDLPITMASTEVWFRRSLENPSKKNFSICVKQTDQVIGMTGLLNIDYKHCRAQFYLTIGEKEFWGQHIPDEVIPMVLDYGFVEHHLNKIYLWTIPENKRARHVYERNGFVQEGVLKEHYFCRGQFHDLIQHGMLRKDWEVIRNKKG